MLFMCILFDNYEQICVFLIIILRQKNATNEQ